MPRVAFNAPVKQPKNKPQGGGIPASEGRCVDFRVSLGEYMAAVIASMAEAEGISQSAFARNMIRDGLKQQGITF